MFKNIFPNNVKKYILQKYIAPYSYLTFVLINITYYFTKAPTTYQLSW